MTTSEQALSSDKEVRLRRNSVGLTGTVIMSAAIMGPAVSTFFNPQFSTPFSGYATPFVYLVALVVMLIVANGIMEMARVAPSAGSFYTYITRALGARAGFTTGGLMFVAYALLAPIELGLIGGYLQETFRQEFNVNIPWIWIGLVPWALMAILAFEGIQTSLRTALALFTAEVIVVVGLALIVVAKGGAHGVTAAPLSPASSPNGFGGLVTGFVFAGLSFVGFEGATALGDEARDPHRTIPRGILYSTLLVGVIYLFGTWSLAVGLGEAKTNALTGSDTPWNYLAATFAPWAKWFVIIGSVSSMLAVMINSNNGIVRIIYTMGRERLLPAPLGRINPRRRTPATAVAYEAAFAVISAIIVGILAGGLGNPVGGFNVYGYFGFALTLAIFPVYALASLATIVYFRRRPDFSVVRHLLLPIVGGVFVIALLIGQIIENQTPPYSWMPWALVVWLVLLVIGAVWLGRTRPQVLARAGSVMADAEVAEEHSVHGAPDAYAPELTD